MFERSHRCCRLSTVLSGFCSPQVGTRPRDNFLRNFQRSPIARPCCSGPCSATGGTTGAVMANAISHDQNFKNLILDYPRESLAFFAAEVAPSAADEVRIVPARQEQLQERLGGHYRELDVPLLVEWTDGRRDAVLFVLEEESHGHRFSPHRFAHYCLDLAELFETDRVVPVAIFLRGGAVSTSLALGTEQRCYLAFDWLACRLAEMPAERWRDRSNLVARVNLPNMNSPADHRIPVYAAAVGGCWNWNRTRTGGQIPGVHRHVRRADGQ